METEECVVALKQCSEIIRLQAEACTQLQHKLDQTSTHVSREDYQAVSNSLKSEKASHQCTTQLLEQEREKARLAEAELGVLKRQLQREKKTFENAFGLLKSQALTDSSKAEELLARCAALEALCSQKDEELACKECTISELQRRLREVKERHGKELMESRVREQQEAYVARHLGEREELPRKRTRKKHT